MANLYKRYKTDGTTFTFWTRFRRDGREIRTDTHTDNLQKAQTFLRRQLGAIEEGLDPVIDPRKVTYIGLRDNLLAHYQTTGRRALHEAGQRLAHLDEFFGN